MKSKKKLLLMGVGVMGALAMGVGATSTFAWFQATASATAVLSKSVNESVTVTEINKSLTGLEVDVLQVSAEVASGTLELAHYSAGGTHNLKTGYLDTAGYFHELNAVQTPGNVLSVQVTVTIKIDPTVVAAGKALATDSATYVALEDIVRGVNDQAMELAAERTTRTNYLPAAEWEDGVQYWYNNSGTWTRDETAETESNFEEQATAHDLYTKVGPTDDASRARFFTTDAANTSDAATSVVVHDNFTLNLTEGNSYTETKTFYVYIYGGDGAGAVRTAEHGVFVDGFSITLSDNV